MNKKISLVIGILSFACLLEASTPYRERYAAVLQNYSLHAGDSLKRKAAQFLIDNMEGHFSPEGKGMDAFTEKAYTFQDLKGIRELMTAWNEAGKQGKTQYVPDSAIVDEVYLTDNIEASFRAWQEAPWREEITFEQFCQYILPYRAKDERLCRAWRDSLRQRYQGVVEGIADMAEAFVLVRDTVMKSVQLSNSYCPYTFDVLLCDHVRRADCDQRCVLLAAVLRSLAIPAAIDGVPMWADYSQRGHAWVSLVKGDGATYTVFEDEKKARRYNRIDASQFLPRYKVTAEDHCPYQVKTEKRAAKVYRMGYQARNRIGREEPYFLADPFAVDVSAEYGLVSSVHFAADGDEPVYLCAYMSGRDWTPVAKTIPKNGMAVFPNVGSGIVCLPVHIAGRRLVPISEPVLVGEEGIVRTFAVDTGLVQRIAVERKYPLYSYMTDQWGLMKGGTFEGSDSPDFARADTLAVIRTMPYGMTEIPVKAPRGYRYLRYKSPQTNRISLAELQFCPKDTGDGDRGLEGTPISEGVDSSRVHMAFDGDLATSAKAFQPGYWIGLDLGEGRAAPVSKVMFAPTTDTNTVEPQHLYELYYFDRQWHLLGRRIADSNSLVFDKVPRGALLLLKDKTKGREERIFEYKDGKQVWY